ncbi:MAG: SPOR domain-containing protein [Azonexus sp.]
MAVAVLAAILATGGVIAVLYRAPTETGQRREAAPNSDPVLREEIAALQASISKLAERIETIAAADQAPSQEAILGERLDVSGWVQLNSRRPPGQESASGERPDPSIGQTADPGRKGQGAEGMEAKLDTLGQRLDSMAEKVLRLTSETERSLAQTLAVPASPGPHRMAPPVVEPNAAAARPVAPDPSTPPATPPPVPDLSAKARVPITGANPQPGAAGASAISEVQAKPVNPGAQVAAAEPVGVRTDPQGLEPVGDAASHRPAPTLPRPKAEQKKWQPLGAILGAEITIRADAVTVPRVREGQVVTNPESAGPLAPLIASEKNEFAKLEIPTAPEVRGAVPVVPPESVVPEASAPTAPPPVAGEEWFINLVAVRSRSTALELQRTYRDKGVDAQVVSLGRNGPFAVRVSGFSSRRDALDGAPAIKTALGIRDVWIARQ